MLVTLLLGMQGYAQSVLNKTIVLEKNSYSVSALLQELNEIHEVSLSYGELPAKGSLTFANKQTTVLQVLDQLVANSPFSYQLIKNKVLIVKRGKRSMQATISGFIRDAESGEALIGATIQDEVTGSGVVANNYGFYSLTLPTGVHTLKISYVGFSAKEELLILDGDVSISFELTSATGLLEEVTVEGSAVEGIELSPQMSTVALTSKQIENVPMILGEYDLMKAIQLLPGIQSGNEGASGIFVRGGGADQNLILLDGVPVYNTAHLFGFFSIFNGDAINNVQVIKGGFPARYGGRLSSVIDISMKEGNNQELTGKATVGLISSKITVEGPIKNEKTSFILSGRRTYLDVLAVPFNVTDNANYYFYDFNTKINHRFSHRDRVFFSFYGGNDYFRATRNENNVILQNEVTDESSLDWGNVVSVLRWNHLFGSRLFGAFSATYSKFDFDTQDTRSLQLQDFQPLQDQGDQSLQEVDSLETLQYASGIKDLSLKASFDYQINPKLNIAFGALLTDHTFNTGVVDLSSEVNDIDPTGRRNITAYEYGAYLENDIQLGKRLRFNIGAHAAMFSVDDQVYYSIQPRFSGRYLFNNQFSLKASYSEMQQFIHLLTNSGVGLPTDLWVPSTGLVKPQYSRQYALGAAKSMGAYEISLEGYYKSMDNLIEYENGASYLSTDTNWEQKVESGSGESYGAELLVRKNSGRLNGWVAYTWSKSNRQFEQLNFGRPFAYKYDRRHDLAITANYALSETWKISSNWVLSSGNALTLPLNKYVSHNQGNFFGGSDELDAFIVNYYTNIIDNFDQRNNYRMRSYHRLDIGVSNTKKKKKGERTWSFGVYNAYSRLNPFYVYVREDYQGITLNQVTLFPAIPYVNFSFKFL